MAAPLMMSVSGVRGIAGRSITPHNVAALVCAFVQQVKDNDNGSKEIILGRDSRVSGPWVSAVAEGVLLAMGMNVRSIGIVPTPTVQLMVKERKSAGGVIVTSSHNPEPWNAAQRIGMLPPPSRIVWRIATAMPSVLPRRSLQNIGLKFVDCDSLFLSPSKCRALYALAEGDVSSTHINMCVDLPYVDVERIRTAKLKVAVDAVNGAGGEIMKNLLEKLGCEVVPLNLEPTGIFSHMPEPVPAHLGDLCELVRSSGANLGIAVDPDADRCVIVDELGIPIGEEYTLALAVDYFLSQTNTEGAYVVKNLSTSRAVDDVAKRYKCNTIAAAVGEINVALKMKEVNAVIGGEGNGGVMLPDVHIGRDSVVAAVLILSSLALSGGTMSELRASMPQYEIVKLKAPLDGNDPDSVIERIKREWEHVEGHSVSDVDGVRIDSSEWWVHLRKSNTEPIVRVIGEANDAQRANEICQRFLKLIVETGEQE